MTRIRFAGLLAALFFLVGYAPIETHDPADVIAHEWGTFTSIAGQDGSAVQWRPQSGPDDLPCFVERLRWGTKAGLAGTVRMETPVIYFYAPEAITLDVSVRFRQGLVTEWFPRAAVTPSFIDAATAGRQDLESRITWKDVTVSPRARPELPTEKGASHYYAARQTDASPLQVGSAQEKFLFYRGVGRFAPPVTAIVGAGGRVAVRNPAGDPIGPVILFENRGGAIRFRAYHAHADRITLDAAVPAGSLSSLRETLERTLVAEGLYAREAAAMVETWRDSWFEEGARLFYIAPKKAIDAILPLDIRPVPSRVARVFVGRMELVTARTFDDVKRAIEANDTATLQKYGRFLDPLVSQILESTPAAGRAALQARLEIAYNSYYAAWRSTTSCK